MAPETLVREFESSRGRIDGSTATFGAPFYGERILGRLVYGPSRGQQHCTAEDYLVPKPEEYAVKDYSQVKLINIVLVERGTCSFVTKVKVAKEKEAHAVIIVDKVDSQLTPEQIREIIMADDGYGRDIDIPSVLISRSEGQKLIDAAKRGVAGSVVVELQWDVPTGHTVVIDMWMGSASQANFKFIKEFKPKREKLWKYIKFVPHYAVFSMEAGQDYHELCSDVTGKYCAEDPDGGGGEAGSSFTGKLVLAEDVRQLCIHELTAQVTETARESLAKLPLAPVPAFSGKWWHYTSIMLDECPLDATKSEEHKFGKACSERVMKKVGGIDVAAVERCMAQTEELKLKEQLGSVAWSPSALRINGWRYDGTMDADLVIRAVCAGFIETPPECTQLVTPRDPFKGFKAQPAGVSFGTMATSFLVMAVVCFGAMFLYKRSLSKSVHSALREEVMLEVQSQMAQYKQLES